MSERYTKKDAEAAFLRLLKATGNREAKSYNDVGGWQLDYNGVYGGFVIHEISNEHGAVSEPFSSERRNAREFCDVVRFTLRALENIRAIDHQGRLWRGQLS